MPSLSIVVALGVAVACTGACTGGEPDQVMDIVFDVWQRAGIDSALALWREHGIAVAATTSTPAEGMPVLEVYFAEGSPVFHGIYEDEVGVIYINRDISDPR
jgi:hypothetical protein